MTKAKLEGGERLSAAQESQINRAKDAERRTNIRELEAHEAWTIAVDQHNRSSAEYSAANEKVQGLKWNLDLFERRRSEIVELSQHANPSVREAARRELHDIDAKIPGARVAHNNAVNIFRTAEQRRNDAIQLRLEKRVAFENARLAHAAALRELNELQRLA